MASPARSPLWPPYPHISIYLETYDDNGTTRSFNTISPVSLLPSAETRPQGGAIHALAAASTQYIPPVSPAATHFTNLSPVWPVPEPLPEISHQQARRPALRFFPTARPRLQLQAVPIEGVEKLGQPDSQPNRQSKLGLGIHDVSPDPSPMPATSPDHGRADRSSNIAQRIEESLWRYSLSGNVLKRWLLEIISWWISALCMATIVGILIYYQNQKLPNWPGSLTLNALIAILSKISSAALILPASEALGQLKWSWFKGHSKKMWDFEIFDNASRGPWGSFLMLIRTKGRALAALGAIITIFSLALDPFFQQVVDFPDRWALQGESSIPRVIQYAPRYLNEFRSGAVMAQQDPDVFAVAKKYFYEDGIQPVPFGNGTRPDIPLSCPTSNCTWPPYETLGICSKCANVSDLLTFACLESTVDWVANLTGGETETTYPNGTMCGFFLNTTDQYETPVMMSGYLLESVQSTGGTAPKGETLLTRMLPLTTPVTKLPVFGGSIHFKEVRNPLLDVIIASAANGIGGVLRNETPIALECVLSVCVKTIKSSYYLATYEEEVIGTIENGTSGPFPWVSEPVVNQGVKGNDIWYRDNVTINAPLTVNGSEFAQYGFQNSTFQKVTIVFDDAFPAVFTVANSSATPIMRYKQYVKGAPF